MSSPFDFEELTDVLSTEGAQSYARGAIIAYGAGQGWSGNQTLTALRSADIGIRRSQFFDVWNAYRDQIAANQTAAALEVDSTTGQLLTGNPPANWTGQYVHQVTGTFRSLNDDGSYALSTRTFGIKSAGPLTPYEASQAALGIIETPIDEETPGGYGVAGDLVSMNLSGVWYDTRPGVLGGLR